MWGERILDSWEQLSILPRPGGASTSCPNIIHLNHRLHDFPTASSLALRQPGFWTWRPSLPSPHICVWLDPATSPSDPLSDARPFRPCPYSSPPRLHDDHYSFVAFAHSTRNCAQLRVYLRFWASRPSRSRYLPVYQAQGRGGGTGSWSGLEDVEAAYRVSYVSDGLLEYPPS